MVQVTTLAGDSWSFPAQEGWTLRDLKDAVKQETGIRMREQRFIDGTRELQEDEPLKDQLHLTLIRRPTEQVLLLQALEDSHHPERVLRRAPEQFLADWEVLLTATAREASCICLAEKSLQG
ncbi:unnamed protein product [Durusdinium trenchii]|uniref:Ubiquitin-like domain-containing protein n=2 Tax=Durusdinium trenchii TaxID=1381693 RepID=A0ABP0M8J7_9DINO